jgi:Baseplate J-like protein
MTFHCCDLPRLDVLQRSGSANAIAFLEVLDKAGPPGAPRQQTLFVRLLRPGFVLTPDNLRITGGERIRTVGILWCAAANALPAQAEAGLADTVEDPARTLVIRTVSSGDFSLYTLSIVSNSGSDVPPAGFDPRLSAIEFSFKVECRADFDCAQKAACPPNASDQPDIDYLAKDYQGFRRLMLDRLSLNVPGWTERSSADLGVALVELLAYAADNLSYRQDAIANEAYLATARQRVSVRRHARLVDYFMHEGCNARAFVHFDVTGQNIALAKGAQLLTRTANIPTVVANASQDWKDALSGGALVFETAHNARLDERLNRLSFYGWGDKGCCLTIGATCATLSGNLAGVLKIGDILIFEEAVSPTTFVAADADRAHRCAVRLTQVTASTDPSGQLFDPVPVDGPVAVTEISWDAADALPFPLCISVEARPGLEISAALGNIVLCDHGMTVEGEVLGAVPPATLALAPAAPAGCCDNQKPVSVPPRFRPALGHAPLTHGFDLDGLLAMPVSSDETWWPASALITIDPRASTPHIARLAGTLGAVTELWTVRRDLLASADSALDFTAEVDDSGRARLRFGDDDHGKRPDPGTAFITDYRFGNGVAGNAGAEAIAHVVSMAAGVFNAVRNPMAAAGGEEPEEIEAVRRDAPQAFRTQERAVTAADYAAAAERRADVQRAAASFRWTGSWHTVFVTPDRFGGRDVDAAYEARLRRHLERFRMAGYDLEVTAPKFVPLDIALHVCVKQDYFRAHVLQAVAEALSSTVRSDGQTGLFHPDNFSFGQPVYLSRVIAAAQAVQGVDSIRVDKFQRMINPTPISLRDGLIDIGGLEIAELANNPNFRERGRLDLIAGGGK